jgi:homoserine O-acetyltransferase
VICSNVLGGCGGTTGPSSIDPKSGKHYGVGFPVVTIGDIVQVQKKLIDFLGIKKLLAVAGGSMGGMQALEWALRYPDAITSCIVIASTTRLSAQSIGFNAVGRTTIMTDPNWKDGQYYGKEIPSTGLAIARMIGHITFLSDKSMHEKFGRRLQSREKFGFDLRSEFEVESYLDYQGQKFVVRFYANCYLYATKAMDYFDLAAYYGDGDLIKAMERAKCRFLVLSFTSDWLFPTYQSVELVDALAYIGLDVTYLDIDSPYGHDSFLLEYEFEEEIIVNFLDATFKKRGGRK